MKIKAEKVIKKCPKIRKDIKGKICKQIKPKKDKKKTRTGFKKSRNSEQRNIQLMKKTRT